MTFTTIARRGRPARTADLTGIGERFGLYQALSGEPLTARELAGRTRTDPHFIHAWLERQAREGFVTYEAATRRYTNYCRWPRN